jgi:hypothetical protein
MPSYSYYVNSDIAAKKRHRRDGDPDVTPSATLLRLGLLAGYAVSARGRRSHRCVSGCRVRIAAQGKILLLGVDRLPVSGRPLRLCHGLEHDGFAPAVDEYLGAREPKGLRQTDGLRATDEE